MLRRAVEPSEDAITAAVIAHWVRAGVRGSLVASIPNKRAFGQAGLTPGLPDLLVLSPQLGPVTGFIELKRNPSGRRSLPQVAIGRLLVERGAPYAVTFGREEPIEILKQWGAIRG